MCLYACDKKLFKLNIKLLANIFLPDYKKCKLSLKRYKPKILRFLSKFLDKYSNLRQFFWCTQYYTTTPVLLRNHNIFEP